VLPVLLTASSVALAACGGASGSSAVPNLKPTARAASAGVNGVNGATASAACAAKVKNLSFYGLAALSSVANSAKAYMEKTHPGLTVTLNITATSYDGLVQQIAADKAAGKTADVAVAGFDQLPVFEKQLGAQVLSPDLLRSTYDQRFLNLGKVDGKLVGIPQQVSAPVLYYNADVLNKAGVDPASLSTTDGILAAATKIKAADPSIQPVDLPTGQQFGYWYLESLAASKGSLLQNTDGSPNLNTPQALEAAQFLAKIGAEGPQSNDPTQNGLLGFGIQRKSAMVAGTLASVGAALKFLQGQGTKGFKVGVMPFPILSGGTQHPIAGGNALTVLSTDECQKEMASEMLVSLQAPDVIAASVEAVSYLPVDTAAATELTSFYQQYPQLKQFTALGGSLVQAPAWGGTRGGEVPQAITDNVIHIMQGADPAKELAAAQTSVTQMTAS
jgi:multiple sugar transport system substrate-binding protein